MSSETNEPKARALSRAVLIVEDEVPQRTMLERAVRSMNFEPTVAGSAEEALDTVGSQPPPLALLDLSLPGKSGLELAAELQARRSSMQFIILTGYGDLDAAREAIRLDVVDFLLKPCPLDELESALERAYTKAVKAAPPPQAAPSGPGTIDRVERDLIEQALARHHGNRTRAAEELGISVRTLYYRLSRYGVEDRFR